MRWGPVLGALLALAGCGGRAVSHYVSTSGDTTDASALPNATPGGGGSTPNSATGGAPNDSAEQNGGTGGAQNGGTGGMQSGGAGGGSDTAGAGAKSAFEGEDCRRDPEKYMQVLEDCSAPFVCPPGTPAFIDGCGCGCEGDKFNNRGTPYAELGEAECGGPSGPFALFESAPTQIVIGSTHVYARIPARRRDAEEVVWAIDKQTRAVARVSSGSIPESMPGSVVSGAEEYESGGVSYSVISSGLDRYSLVAQTNEDTRTLFEIPYSYALAFVVVDSEFYACDETGKLFRAIVAPSPGTPFVVERRGEWDDDDHAPFLGADPDAVYWLSGPLEDARVHDEDPLALYRTCR